ncbi:hypothetical protein J6590_090181 [Homalodisca vitripennis]|nr:hypothetical protein J6590_097040 [Homalodisca vitripennis]KAG8304586.1 hypothetical protein J6590_090181 [Homalodisca vitripennis]
MLATSLIWGPKYTNPFFPSPDWHLEHGILPSVTVPNLSVGQQHLPEVVQKPFTEILQPINHAPKGRSSIQRQKEHKNNCKNSFSNF